MNKMQNFVVWLDGYLEATGDEINIGKTLLIKSKLNGLFEHDAEKISEESKKESLKDLGVKHGFKVNDGIPGSFFPGRDEDGNLYRC